MEKPEGGFGWVTDVNRLAASRDLVNPGKPGDSYLYELLRDHEMPPPDSEALPLSEEELRTVYRWITEFGRSR